jgi:hypothetical protein
MENELLNKNDTKNVKISPEEDHLSHMLIHSQAEKTPATTAHINAHKMAYFESDQRQRDMETANAQKTDKTSANVAQNQVASQDTKLNNTNNNPESIGQAQG